MAQDGPAGVGVGIARLLRSGAHRHPAYSRPPDGITDGIRDHYLHAPATSREQGDKACCCHNFIDPAYKYVEIVNADNVFAVRQQSSREMVADESGGAGDENFHEDIIGNFVA